MKKSILFGLATAIVFSTSTLAMASGEVTVFYAPESTVDYPKAEKLETTANYFGIEGSYSFDKKLKLDAFLKATQEEEKTVDTQAEKMDKKTSFGAGLSYDLTKDLKVKGFFDYRTVLTKDDEDKSTRLRYGVKGEYSIDKLTLSSSLRNTSFEYADEYKDAKWDESERELRGQLKSPFEFNAEASYNLFKMKKTAKLDALVNYHYENAEDGGESIKTSGFGIGVKGNYKLDKLSADLKLVYSPLQYEIKGEIAEKVEDYPAGKYDKDQIDLELGLVYPLTDKWFITGDYEMVRADFKGETAWDYAEDNFKLGVGMKF